MGRLDQKIVLVTGAARGIGESISRVFASEGAQVILTDINDELGQQKAASIGKGAT